MKRWIMGIAIFLIIVLASVYIFIPSRLEVSSSVTINVTENSCRKFLIDDDNNWHKWWLSANGSKNNEKKFTYNDYQYKITGKTVNVIDVIVSKNNDSIFTHLIIVPLKLDSIGLLWKTNIESGVNPIKKLAQYQLAKTIKNNASAILKNLKLFLENEENIYLFDIQRTLIRDTLLTATKFKTATSPSVEDIYKSIAVLNTRIAATNTKKTGYPMVYTMKINDAQFETMVAIPVNKEIPADDTFLIKKMIPGNVLVTRVKGGNYLIRKAYDALENYLQDYHLTSPAVPFESLINDRTIVGDTSKWETNIYYPIF